MPEDVSCSLMESLYIHPNALWRGHLDIVTYSCIVQPDMVLDYSRHSNQTLIRCWHAKKLSWYSNSPLWGGVLGTIILVVPYIYHLLGEPLYNTSNCSIHQLHLILHYHMLSSSATAPSMHEKYSSIVLSVTLCVAAISESSGVKSRPWFDSTCSRT